MAMLKEATGEETRDGFFNKLLAAVNRQALDYVTIAASPGRNANNQNETGDF